MSTGGTKRQRTRADLLRRLEVLRPGPTDIFLLKLPAEYFDPEQNGPNDIAGEFAEAVMRASRRPVFIVQEGREELLYGPPDVLGVQRKPQPPPVAVPRPKIHLPGGVRLDGI